MIQGLKQRIDSYFGKWGSQEEWSRLFASLSTPSQEKQFYILLSFKGILQSKDYCVSVIKYLKGQNLFNSDKFLDALWACSSVIESSSQDPKQDLDKSFKQLIAGLSESGTVDKLAMIERLSEKAITDSNIIAATQYSKKLNRTSTMINLYQTKYNLLKQANEGYSKILLILLTLKQNDNAAKLYQIITSHIGNFDLDPDRVLDLVLDSFIQNPSNNIYLELMNNFEKSAIPKLIGQKLNKQAVVQSQSQKLKLIDSVQSTLVELSINPTLFMSDPLVPNTNLIKVIAQLVKKGSIQLSQVFGTLLPSNEYLEKDAERRYNTHKSKLDEVFIVNTEEPSEVQKKQRQIQQKTDFFGQYLYSSKIWLMNYLVEINDWQHFNQIIYLLGGKIDLLSHLPTLNNLFELLDWSISPLWQKISLKRLFKSKALKTSKVSKTTKFKFQSSVRTQQIKQISQVSVQFFNQFDQILKVINNYIGFNSRLFGKLCRLLKRIVDQKQLISQNMSIAEINQKVKEIVQNYLLPSINCQNSSPSFSLQLFPLLMTFNYTIRMEIYNMTFTKLMLSCGYFCRQSVKIKKQQNIIFNTLSKDNKKLYFKRVGKLSHNHFFYLFYWVARRMMIGDYEAMVPEIVNILVNCTKLSLESFIFIILYFISNERNNDQQLINTKNSQLAAWFKNCYSFLCLFYRKYYDTDLMMMFGYVISKLVRTIRDVQIQEMPAVQLKVMKELLSKMSGIVFLENMTKDQLPVLAAGPKLQLEILTPTVDLKAAKRSKTQLQFFFLKKMTNFHNNLSLAFYLLVTICQKRSQFLYKSSILNMQHFSAIYDQYTSSFTQLLKVLNMQASDHQAFLKILPAQSLSQMILTYKIPLELAFTLSRYATKNVTTMLDEEWGVLVRETYAVIQQYLKRNDMVVRGLYDRPELLNYLNLYKQKFTKYIPEELFCMFWYLSLDSIYYPSQIYLEKLEELKKKQISEKDKQLEKTKSLYQKLYKQSETQKKKFQEATNQIRNRQRLVVEKLKSQKKDKQAKDKNNSEDYMLGFIQVFTQTCIIPRLLLEPSDALYCAKFIVLFINSNEFNSNKGVKLIAGIVETSIPYLSCCTYKETLQCLSVFLSQLLNIFVNWNDPQKLKNDFVTKLGTDESLIKDNYTKMKQFLMHFFQRVGSAIKGQRDQPFNIKNGLYLLDRLDVIPAYRQQAQEFELYLKEMKGKYGELKDMRRILDRVANMIISKKSSLPQKPVEQRKKEKLPNIQELKKKQSPPAPDNQGSKIPSPLDQKSTILSPPAKVMDVEKQPTKNSNSQNTSIRNKQKDLNRQKKLRDVERGNQKYNQASSSYQNKQLQKVRQSQKRQFREKSRNSRDREINDKEKDKNKEKQKQKERDRDRDRDRERDRQKDRMKDKSRERQRQRQGRKFTTNNIPPINNRQVTEVIQASVKTVKMAKQESNKNSQYQQQFDAKIIESKPIPNSSLTSNPIQARIKTMPPPPPGPQPMPVPQPQPQISLIPQSQMSIQKRMDIQQDKKSQGEINSRFTDKPSVTQVETAGQLLQKIRKKKENIGQPILQSKLEQGNKNEEKRIVQDKNQKQLDKKQQKDLRNNRDVKEFKDSKQKQRQREQRERQKQRESQYNKNKPYINSKDKRYGDRDNDSRYDKYDRNKRSDSRENKRRR